MMVADNARQDAPKPAHEPNGRPKRAKKQKKPKKKGRWRRRILWFFAFDFLAATVVIMAGMLYIRHRLDSLPVVDAQYLATYGPSKITDKDGEVIWQPSDKRAVQLSFKEIPEFYKTAIVAVEDADFWESRGVSIKGVANMVYGVVRSKVDKSYVPRGGSTIEQQLIKNKFYDRGVGHETTTRKIQELFLAMQLDENFTKEEILTFYVNHLEYAEGSTGLGAIMMTYFGKSPKDYKKRSTENIAELAYLAGLSQAPGKYNLYKDPDAAKKRKDIVLSILKEGGHITEKEYKKAKKYDLAKNLKPRGWESQAQVEKNKAFKVYTDGVRKEIADMGYDLDALSVTIKSFLDQQALSAVTALARDPKYYLDAEQQAAVAVVDTNGVVVALVGSRNEGDEFNRALSDTRSSGSSMKPFTAYGPLLQYFGGMYDTTSRFDTSNYQYPGSTAVMHNAGGGTYGMQDMQHSLRHSYNTVVARIDDEILGSVRMKTFLHGVGLDVKDTYSSVDGIGLNISPLQSAAAYNAINAGGVYTKPRFIDTITFSDGSVKEVAPTQVQAMNPSVAYVLSQMLKGVPGGDGTASRAEIPEYEGYAGKTGSVKFDSSVNAPKTYGEGASDVWYCSYTNGGYAVSIWCGYDQPNTSPRIPNYYKGQQEMNRDIQRLLNGEREVPNWEMPEGAERIGGEGLYAHYRVTDSRDLGDTGMSFTEVSGYAENEVKSVQSQGSVPENWQEQETSPWLNYYMQNGREVPDIIDAGTYEMLGGGG